jgi:hypothetical protein
MLNRHAALVCLSHQVRCCIYIMHYRASSNHYSLFRLSEC